MRRSRGARFQVAGSPLSNRGLGDVDRLLRGPGNGRQLLRGAPGDAVIVGTEIGAVQAHAMDEAGLAIGDEQRLRLRIEGEPAESSP